MEGQAVTTRDDTVPEMAPRGALHEQQDPERAVWQVGPQEFPGRAQGLIDGPPIRAAADVSAPAYQPGSGGGLCVSFADDVRRDGSRRPNAAPKNAWRPTPRVGCAGSRRRH